jgi:cell division protein FtsI (penicillin-binding protein 3)
MPRSFSTPHGRIQILIWLLFIVMAIFVARLFYLQLVRHDFYTDLARQEQIKQLIIPADRGEIYALDRGEPVKMVLNEQVYTVFVDPIEVKEPEAIEKAVNEVAGGTAVEDIAELAKQKPSRYQIVARNVTRKQAELLKEKELAGLGFQPGSRRIYPEGKLAAQVLGFVNAEGKAQYGVEAALNDSLKGKDGLQRSVTDIANVPLTIGSENTEVPAKDGENVVLTIDRNVQSFTEKALRDGLKKYGATNGSAIVMDPQTGKVLAMANYPTYNPEKYNKVTNPQAFNNAIISMPYEPGSVMKTFTVATAIDKGVITPKSTYNNTDYIKVEDRTITNAAKGQTGTITIQHALNWSLNTGMVTVAQRLGDGKTITREARQTMYTYFHDRFGLGQPTGIKLAGEAYGHIIPPSKPEGNAVRYSNMSFGQGLDITMLQVASGFGAMINGGRYYQPTIIAGTVDENGVYHQSDAPRMERRVISEDTSKTVKKMIRNARKAFYSNSDKKGYDIGGKTGTSQGIVNGKYTFNETIASYLGYGGDTQPRYVIMVQVSGKGKKFEGNIHAQPIFTTISNWMIDYMALQPKG